MPTMSMARTGWAARRVPPGPPRSPRCTLFGLLIATLSARSGDSRSHRSPDDRPLTNLALALQRAPGITGGIGVRTIMGGTAYGRGNVTPAAEFNIFSDPEAAAIVFDAAIDTTVVPWKFLPLVYRGPTRSTECSNPRTRQRLQDLRAGARAARLPTKHIRTGQGDCLFFIDPLAAALSSSPAMISPALRACLAAARRPASPAA